MVNSVESTTIDLQTTNTCTSSSTTCISIQGLTTTSDGNYETDGSGFPIFLDVNWNIPKDKTLTVKVGDTLIISSKLTVIGKIIVEGTLDNLSANSLNITGSGAVIIKMNGILNNGNGKDSNGSIKNTGSLVVYGTLKNNIESKLDNTSGEVSYSGTIENNDGTIEIKAKSADIMIALDISDSMLAEDVYPSRLKY